MKKFEIASFKDNIFFKSNPENFKMMIEILNTSCSGFSKAISNKKSLIDWFKKCLPLLADEKYSIATKCHWILNGLIDFPKCDNPNCDFFNTSNAYIGKNVKLVNGYSKFCNRKCQNTHPEVQKKQQNTCLKHFGVKYSLQAESVKNKSKQTLRNKYQITNFSQHKKHHELQLKKSYENFILKNNYDIPLFTIDDYLNRSNANQYLKFKCKICGNIFLSRHIFGKHHRCEKCFPNNQISFLEKEIVDYLKSIFKHKIIENDCQILNPKELDIYIPEKKLAIEFDGLYWHSDENKPRNYHLNKTELCEKQNIQLIHIFENEWVLKQDIVKSRLKNLLGIYDKTIYARCCKIKEVSSKESKLFQNDNHIQGAVNSKINLGLFYNDELISLMTFGKCRFNKKYEYELLRFCNRLGYHIPGSASKLLKYFERNYQPKSLISYADRRWSKGNVYEKLGFKLDHIASPNYWYWKDIHLLSRVQFQKHKLKKTLEKYDPLKSETENMKANGYNRIFDCGNLVYVKEF